MSIENLILHRMSCFFLNGYNHPNDTIKDLFCNVLVSSSSCMLRNINSILDKINMKYYDFLLTNKHELKREFSKTDSDPDWRVNIVEELLNIRDNQIECDLDRNETIMFLKYISIYR